LVDDDDCIALAKAEIEAEIEEEGLNLLINNAAIHEHVGIFDSIVISVDEWRGAHVFQFLKKFQLVDGGVYMSFEKLCVKTLYFKQKKTQSF
jgi:hypothetical protein